MGKPAATTDRPLLSSSGCIILGFVFSLLGGFALALAAEPDLGAFYILGLPLAIFGSLFLMIGVIAKGVALGNDESR